MTRSTAIPNFDCNVAHVRDKTRGFAAPLAFASYFPDAFLDLDAIVELLRALPGWAPAAERSRVFVDGEAADAAILRTRGPDAGEALETWFARTFDGRPTFVVLNKIESLDDGFFRRFRPFVDDLLAVHGYPVGGLELTILLGNYGYTPFGIHQDPDYDFCFQFFLGPATKTAYFWEADAYRALAGDAEWIAPSPALVAAASLFELQPRDLFVLPNGDTYHVAHSPELTVSVNIEVTRYDSPKIGAALLPELQRELFEDPKVNRRHVVSSAARDCVPDFDLSADLPAFSRDVRLAEYVRARLQAIEQRRFSNKGFAATEPRPSDGPLAGRSFRGVDGFPLFAIPHDDGSATLLSRGHACTFAAGGALCEAVARLNAGRAIVADGAAPVSEILAFLYATRGIDPIASEGREPRPADECSPRRLS